MCTLDALSTLTPLIPGLAVLLAPLMEMWRSVTMSVVNALMITPFVPAARIEAHPAPVPPSIVIDLVIVTAPKPPGSRASISPPAAVFEIAPAKVLQGAVRLHGLASSPTPETQVRVACAWAEVVGKDTMASNPKRLSNRLGFLMLGALKELDTSDTVP